MSPKITRRQFLQLGGQAVAAGAVCSLCTLGTNATAEAAGEVPLDGGEMVCRVGDTFATIHLVPRYTKTKEPVTIRAKVQYGTDPSFANYVETASSAKPYSFSERDRHLGEDGSSTLVVSKSHKFLRHNWDIQPGDLILNVTDDSVMTVSAVTGERTIEGTLEGGTRNCWNNGDVWKLFRTYYSLAVNLTGLQPNTKYYYRVLIKYGGDPWPAPRAAHSFRTRRPAGQAFRFVISADPHRDTYKSLERKHWSDWDALVGSVRAEGADFVVDVGDTWMVCRGDGAPRSKYFPVLYSMVMTPTRNGVAGYRGLSDMCADCGYYMARGNHEGLKDCDGRKTKELLTPLLKLFICNPNGQTYPQGGSQDADYDQGYFAFEWGDALFVPMDVVKYKENKRDNKSPTRFHIGDAQLAWLTAVLQNSQHRWKFIFMHHLFGGADFYGRGGAIFAYDHEHAQIQALAEQYGAHIFCGHDHLVASDMVGGVHYYTCGSACGGIVKFNRDELYPNGYVVPCDLYSCEKFGYVVVEVSPTQVRIQYKNCQGVVVPETEVVLT